MKQLSNNKIIIIDNEPVNKDYPKSVYKFLFNIESKHFWFWGRNKIIQRLIKNKIKNKNNLTFFEVGCGTGYVLSLLERIGFQVTGLDMHLEGLKIAQRRVNGTLWCGDINSIKSHKQFDAVGLFDVLEHVDKEDIMLKQIKKFLNRDGLLFITVPAHMSLWSVVDEVSGHKTRYTKKDLTSLLVKNGYQIQSASYYGSFLYFPLYFLRKLRSNKTLNKKDIQSILLSGGLTLPPLLLNLLFKGLFLIEEKILQFVTLPVGTSLIIVAKKYER